jgi:hypothetical protein
MPSYFVCSEFKRFHSECMRGHQALVIRINEAQELCLGPVESVQGGLTCQDFVCEVLPLFLS